MWKGSARVVVLCLAGAGAASAQVAQPVDVLQLPEQELERMIYRRADSLRAGRVQQAASATAPARQLGGHSPNAKIRLSTRQLQTLAQAAAQAFGIPRHLAFALIQVESNWNPRAVSSKGAVGLTQVLPSTARGLQIDCDLFDPECNLRAGFAYLRAMLDIFNDPRRALAAYNAGPGVFSKRYSPQTRTEIESYVRAVVATANRLHRTL